MSTIFYDTTGSFSALTPKKVVAGAYAPVILYSSFDALNTARYQAFTASDAGDMEGAVVCIKNQSTTTTDNVTVVLQEDSGGGFADVAGATKTLTVTNLAGTHSTVLTGSPMWVYFKFATAKTITTDAARWRLKISSNTASIGIYQTYGYAVVLTTTTTYTSGDNIIIDSGVIVTQDQSVVATNLIVGVNTHWLVPSTVAASYALTITNLWFSKDFRLACGEDDTHRIPFAKQFTLTITNWKNGEGYQGGQNYEFELWGEKPTNYFTLLNANVSATQKVLVTTQDMSATWVNSDVLIVMGRSSATLGYESMVLDTISGTSITCTANFASIHYSGWAVINSTKAAKCGIVLSCGTIGYQYTSWTVANVSGVNLTSESSLSFFNGNTFIDTARVTTRYVDTVIMSVGGSIRMDALNIIAGGTWKYIFCWGTTTLSSGGNLALTSVLSGNINNIYLTNLGHIYSGVFPLTATSSTISDIQMSGAYTTYPGSAWNVTLCTINRIKIISGQPTFRLISVGSTFNTGSIDYSTSYGLYINGIVTDTTFNDFDFGQDYAPTTNDVYMTSNYYCRILFNNCKFTATKEVGNTVNAVSGSYIKTSSYNDTTNDHRSWWLYGKTVSTGDGLTDTTVHTAGTGKFALRFEPLSSTNNLTWDFTIPTGDISTKTMTVSMWVKINSATYYAGTHQNPRLTIDYDNGTTSYAEATDSTAWQLLTVSFTPTTSYGQITVTVSGKTDATTTNAYFYVDDFGVAYPPSVALDLGGLDNWANGLPVTPPVSLPISAGTVAQQVWQQLTTTSWGTNSMGEQAKVIPGQIKYINGGELPVY